MRIHYGRRARERYVYALTLESLSPHRPAPDCGRSWCLRVAAVPVDLGLYASPEGAQERALTHCKWSDHPVAQHIRDRRPEPDPVWTVTLQRDRWTWTAEPHARAVYRIERKRVL